MTRSVQSQARVNAGQLSQDLADLGIDRLAEHGLYRDPGQYNLLVHMVPPEVSRDHAATPDVQRRLQQPIGPFSLYLHVPACTGRCTFCHYAITVNPDDAAMQAYLLAMQREITQRWQHLGPDSPPASILIGGGTPTYLSALQLEQLLGHLHKTVRIPNGIEFTVEGSPETLDPAKLQVLRDHGVNRFSLGLQSLQDDLLRTLGRRHDGRGAHQALEMVRQAGFGHINVDLIYALPGQTLDHWTQDLQSMADFSVDSLTTYHLRKRPDTAISRHPSPSQHDNMLMHYAALQVLDAAGYRQSLVDYFCKKELETAQVQARDKWRDMQPVDGCGLEACSRRADTIAFNQEEMATYTAAIAAGQGWALAHGRFLSVPEQMAQRAMFALKVLDKDGGIDLPVFQREFGMSVAQAFGDTPQRLIALGALQQADNRLQLTKVGSLVADEVCQQFWTEELRRQMVARVKVEASGSSVPVPRGSASRALATADVVVIGAGVVGLATAAALAEDLGAGVLLVEAESLVGQGATAASIGGFRVQFDDPVLAELTVRALPEYQQLADGPEGDRLGLRRSGYLFLASDAQDAAQCARQAAIAQKYGEIVEQIDDRLAQSLVPGLQTVDLHSLWWGARDGQVDPHGAVQLLQRKFLNLGGRLRLQDTVTGLRVSQGRVLGVQTASGWIAAGQVVLAAGSACGELLQKSGVTLPFSVARRRMVFAQGPGLPPAGPLVLSRQPPLYFRCESNGVLLSARELANESPEDATDWLNLAAARAVERLPALAHARIRPAWSGVQTHTADGLPYVGPCPGLDGLWLAAGLGGTGVMHAPAVGRLIAQGLGGVTADALRLALDPRRLSLR